MDGRYGRCREEEVDSLIADDLIDL